MLEEIAVGISIKISIKKSGRTNINKKQDNN